MVSAWTCDSLSWFQSAIVFTHKILKLFGVGCRYYKTSGVVSCWTTFEDTWSGKCLGLMCILFVLKNVSVGRAGINPLTVRYTHFSVWLRRLLSNVSRLRLVSRVVTDPGCLER